MEPKIKTGLEVLVESELSIIQNRKVGILANHTAVDSQGRHIVQLLSESSIKISALFAPEHGFYGTKDELFGNYFDQKLRLPIFSLYGETKKPTKEMLKDIEVLLFDIQDVGARFYTYIWTMSYAQEASGESGIQFIVLDRPNPINGLAVEGNLLEEKFSSFVGRFPIPIRHGLTVGELSLIFQGEFGIGKDVKVIKMKNWQRQMWHNDTGLPWIAPSPAMVSLDTATVYPGTCLFEGTNISEGRGTDKPFELIGAPWIDAHKFAPALNAKDLPGVNFEPTQFIPKCSKYANETCCGVKISVTNRNAFKPVETSLYILEIIHRLYPNQFQWRLPAFDLLMGTDKVRQKFSEGNSAEEIIGSWQEDLQKFRQVQNKYLLY
ncbi:MAG: DUF1343 domain-containing protein [candidate division WOR-3 bacterium]